MQSDDHYIIIHKQIHEDRNKVKKLILANRYKIKFATKPSKYHNYLVGIIVKNSVYGNIQVYEHWKDTAYGKADYNKCNLIFIINYLTLEEVTKLIADKIETKKKERMENVKRMRPNIMPFPNFLEEDSLYPSSMRLPKYHMWKFITSKEEWEEVLRCDETELLIKFGTEPKCKHNNLGKYFKVHTFIHRGLESMEYFKQLNHDTKNEDVLKEIRARRVHMDKIGQERDKHKDELRKEFNSVRDQIPSHIKLNDFLRIVIEQTNDYEDPKEEFFIETPLYLCDPNFVVPTKKTEEEILQDIAIATQHVEKRKRELMKEKQRQRKLQERAKTNNVGYVKEANFDPIIVKSEADISILNLYRRDPNSE